MSTRAMTAMELKELYDRKARAMARRPDFGRSTGQACVRLLGEGLACDIHHEDRRARADQPESEGGTGTGARPGQLMRASLGASMAMGYRVWAARLGTPIESVDVEIVCEYDTRGQLGVAPEIPVGWQRITFHAIVFSPAPEDEVRRLVEIADRLNPMLANLSPAVERTHRLTVMARRNPASSAK